MTAFSNTFLSLRSAMMVLSQFWSSQNVRRMLIQIVSKFYFPSPPSLGGDSWQPLQELKDSLLWICIDINIWWLWPMFCVWGKMSRVLSWMLLRFYGLFEARGKICKWFRCAVACLTFTRLCFCLHNCCHFSLKPSFLLQCMYNLLPAITSWKYEMFSRNLHLQSICLLLLHRL